MLLNTPNLGTFLLKFNNTQVLCCYCYYCKFLFRFHFKLGLIMCTVELKQKNKSNVRTILVALFKFYYKCMCGEMSAYKNLSSLNMESRIYGDKLNVGRCECSTNENTIIKFCSWLQEAKMHFLSQREIFKLRKGLVGPLYGVLKGPKHDQLHILRTRATKK